AISAFFEAQFKGIVVQAVGLTFGVTFVLLGAYMFWDARRASAEEA
ncbi:hypothetical protein FBQ97_14510, partial [Acidobacteria bacterium ACD]|nr:hypothetical protein [Acidobacteria bacterium ACD]